MREKTYIIRYGEIGLKGQNRPYFEKSLEKNILRTLDDQEASIEKTYGRLYLHTALGEEEVTRQLKRVFGIAGFAPVHRVKLNLEDIKEKALEIVREKVGNREMTFKVETRRPNKSFPVNSLEVSRILGAHLLENLENLSVDVHNPQMKVHVELRENATLHLDGYTGPGGLPVGSSSRGLLLLSGGIDSPVAGWFMLKRGIAVRPVHFHSPPYTSERSLEKVIDICKILKGWGLRQPFFKVNFTPIQEKLLAEVPKKYLTLIMRRMMIRIVDILSKKRGEKCLITGESLGQVASQTVESLLVTGTLTELPLFRPLIGLDKQEIISKAEEIGTYETSIMPFEDCCQVFVPEHPVTRPRLKDIEEIEENLQYSSLIKEAAEKVEELDF